MIKLKWHFDRTQTEITIAVIAALVAAAGIGYWMLTLYDAKQTIGVVAASRDLKAPVILTKDDIKTLHLAHEVLPETGVADPEGAIGQVLTRSVSKNEILTTADLIYQRDPSSESTLVPGGQVGFVLPNSWLASPMPRVKKNDFVTVLVGIQDRQGAPGGTGVTVKDARVLYVFADKDGFPFSILLALDEDSSRRLLEAKTNQYQIAVVVESAEPSPAAAATSTPTKP